MLILLVAFILKNFMAMQKEKLLEELVGIDVETSLKGLR